MFWFGYVFVKGGFMCVSFFVWIIFFFWSWLDLVLLFLFWFWWWCKVFMLLNWVFVVCRWCLVRWWMVLNLKDLVWSCFLFCILYLCWCDSLCVGCLLSVIFWICSRWMCCFVCFIVFLRCWWWKFIRSFLVIFLIVWLCFVFKRCWRKWLYCKVLNKLWRSVRILKWKFWILCVIRLDIFWFLRILCLKILFFWRSLKLLLSWRWCRSRRWWKCVLCSRKFRLKWILWLLRLRVKWKWFVCVLKWFVIIWVWFSFRLWRSGMGVCCLWLVVEVRWVVMEWIFFCWLVCLICFW